MTVDQAVEKLSETKQVTRTHTVVAGDTFASIASNAGMTEAELLKANPSISAESKTNLQIGQKLTVTSNVPVLPIRTFKTTTKEEIIDFTAVRTKNYNMPVGYSKVTTPGQEGKKQVIEKIPYINGEQSGQVQKSEKVISQPVTKQIEVGAAQVASSSRSDDDTSSSYSSSRSSRNSNSNSSSYSYGNND